jgi:hypothetical protein
MLPARQSNRLFRNAWALAALLAIPLFAHSPALAQCAGNADCKAGWTCEDGACVSTGGNAGDADRAAAGCHARCDRTLQRCIARIDSMDDCLDHMQNVKCPLACARSGLTECGPDELCARSAINMSQWKKNCRAAAADDRDECESEREDCDDGCLD